MKLTFTFILACFVVCSVMGQTEKIRSNEFAKIHQYISNIFDFENVESLRVEPHSLKDFLFNQSKVSMLKSAQTETQLLDSDFVGSVNVTGEMVISGKTIYTYNSSGKERIDFSYSLISTSEWVVGGKREITYDSNGHITLCMGYFSGIFANEWINNVKEEYTYDINGNNTVYNVFFWDIIVNKWVDSYKYEYTYDSNDNRILEIEYSWNTSKSMWENNYKSENTYDSDGKHTMNIIYSWNTSNSKWVVRQKYEPTYDSNGNVTMYYYYDWDIVNNMWAYYAKTEYAYDSNNNLILYVSYNWDKSNSKWVVDWKEEYTYNTTFGYQLFDKIYNWNIDSNNWEFSRQTINYYSLHDVTGIRNVLNADIKICPNPVTNGFRISGLTGSSSIILSDMNGKVLFSKEVANDEYVSTDALSQGIYLVRINTSDGSMVKKLVKR